MPKLTVYLRVGKRGPGSYTVVANASPNLNPIKDGYRHSIPTVAFGVRITLPDSVFEKKATVVADITVPEEALGVLRPVDVQVEDVVPPALLDREGSGTDEGAA